MTFLRTSSLFATVCVVLMLALCFISCTSYVVITPPFPAKLRVGDGIKLTMKDGTVYTGRVLYLDQGSIVIRTPKQKTSESPVEVAKFGTTIPWANVLRIKVAGTLDSQHKLISNEEIRVNLRTNHRRNYGINVGLLGTGLSFLTAAFLQDQISPPTTNVVNFNHTQGRITFWTAFIGGSLASFVLGYQSGTYLDRQVSIARIERFRAQLRETAQDSSRQQPSSLPTTSALPLPASQ